MRVENKLALVGILSASLCIVLFVWGVRLVTEQQFRERPDPAFTPGLAKPITVDEVCGDRPVPESPRTRAPGSLITTASIGRSQKPTNSTF